MGTEVRDPRLDDPAYNSQGTGISNKTAAWELADHLRIEKDAKPRGTHTLGIAFSSKRGKHEEGTREEGDSSSRKRGAT